MCHLMVQYYLKTLGEQSYSRSILNIFPFSDWRETWRSCSQLHELAFWKALGQSDKVRQ